MATSICSISEEQEEEDWRALEREGGSTVGLAGQRKGEGRGIWCG